jgi:hypothetical protein
MNESNYYGIENKIYIATKIAAGIGVVGGTLMTMIGPLIGNHDLAKIGADIVFPSGIYYFGTTAAESQFKIREYFNIEKKLE